MPLQSLGHVVLKVRDLQRSEAFYEGTLGLPINFRISDPVHMTFFTLSSNHHDFALMEVGPDAPSPHPGSTGLAHVAFKIGDSHEDFTSMRSILDSDGIDILYTAERAFTTSMHLHDPDGNEVELYIDTADSRTTNVPVQTGD